MIHSHILPEHDVRPYSIAQLAERAGAAAAGKLRKLLAVLVGIGHEREREAAP